VAFFAAWQIFLSRREANARAVFEHLRELDERVQEAWPHTSGKARKDLLDYFGGERTDLTDGARAFLALLNSLDILAFGLEAGYVDHDLAIRHIRTLVNPDVIPKDFIDEFQRCCRDSNIYEDLKRLLHKLESEPAQVPRFGGLWL